MTGHVEPDRVTPETWLIVGGRPEPAPGAPLNVPVVAASTYVLGSERIYSRNEATQGWEAFEAMLGGLEGGQAVAFSSGMAACAAVLGPASDGRAPGARGRLLPGSRRDRGGGSARSRLAPRAAGGHGPVVAAAGLGGGPAVARVAVEPAARGRRPRLDLRRAARARATRIVVDNTFATPLLQRPLELGADIVVHSATKLIGGHSDLLLGAAVTADPGQLELLRAARGRNGATPGMLECFLALRGARTLALRLRHASARHASSLRGCRSHPAVVRCALPELRHDRQLRARERRPPPTARAARPRSFATRRSLGGVETTMERRSAHPGQEHIPAGLIRLSVGCEELEDVWADLDAALTRSVVRP